MSAPVIRNAIEGDEAGISSLFSAVYGDRYVYPEVYLPSVIQRYHRDRIWHSAVALSDGNIVGHAALVTGEAGTVEAELALIAVHPAWRNQGVATTLARHLCDDARQTRRFDLLTIKQVSAHASSQRLALTLGFQTTGLLLDYVTSPFGGGGRETVILGCLALDPETQAAMRKQPVAGRGTRAVSLLGRGSVPAIALTDGRLDVSLYGVEMATLCEVANLPRQRLTHVSLPVGGPAREAMDWLEQHGFACAGMAPRGRGDWHWLMQRGFSPRKLDIRCPHAQRIYDGMCARSVSGDHVSEMVLKTEV